MWWGVVGIGEARFGQARPDDVWYGEVVAWFGEVRFGQARLGMVGRG